MRNVRYAGTWLNGNYDQMIIGTTYCVEIRFRNESHLHVYFLISDDVPYEEQLQFTVSMQSLFAIFYPQPACYK